ncbi:MAG: PLP-dependent aminotransferase family protein [Chloroflexia bacterium]|nr:PLP-dependent aminotransferase family protein [Chloroflexia bacterium]
MSESRQSTSSWKTTPAAPAADLGLQIDRRDAAPLYRQIAAGVRHRIVDGTLPLGNRLPPERRLAAALGVDRTTVVAAYRELAAEGLVRAHVGRGTTVSAPRTSDPARPVPVQPLAWEHSFTRGTDEDPILDELAALSARPEVISFASGIPAPEYYPTAEIRQLLDEALGAGGKGLLQYCPVEGFAPLREAIAARMTARGGTVTPEQVLVCSGSQQGLYLLARALLEPGELVGVEAPTYYGALQVFRAVGARIVTIPADRDGPDPERLDHLLAHRAIKLLYLLPTFQNPTGATLSLERRQRILAVTRRHQVPVVEDDPYGELRYEGTSLPTLAELDPGTGSVVYLSTFSKALFPGFRLGWIMAPPVVIARLAWMKALVDLDSNPLAQWAVASYLERGWLDRHLNRVRQIYPERRNVLVAALAREAGRSLAWEVPEGGFYLWARLAGGVRAREVLAEALGRGVAFVPGDIYHADGGGRDALRLAFSGLPPEQLTEGANRLAEAIRTVVERRARTRSRPTPISTRIV